MRRPLRRIVESVAPSRLGSSFRWLLASSWTTNLGDGIAIAAGPLLIASQTRDPRLVSTALLLEWLAPLLFSLYAGALADRLDRRRLMVAMNAIRALLLVGLAAVIWAGQINVPLVLVALFLLGVTETFADTTASTLLPMLVGKKDLGVANARLTAGFITANELAGPPIGAFLFAVGMAWPFAIQAVAMALGAVLVARIAANAPAPRREGSSIHRDVMEGARWLWNHAPLRTLALTLLSFNVTFGAAWAVMVLYATERLGLGEIGFGLLTTMGALGGLLGTIAYGRLEARFSLADIMRGGLIIETLTHLTLALTTTPWVAMTILFLFGGHEYVWNTTAVTIRQRAVPDEFQGRVGSVSTLASMAGLVIGAPIGGYIANRWGLAGPFWFAFAGSVVILVLIWRTLGHIAHADETV